MMQKTDKYADDVVKAVIYETGQMNSDSPLHPADLFFRR